MKYNMRDTPDMSARRCAYMWLSLDRTTGPFAEKKSFTQITKEKEKIGDFISFQKFNDLLDAEEIVDKNNSRDIPSAIKFATTFDNKEHEESVKSYEKYLKKAYSLGIVGKDEYMLTNKKLSNPNNNYGEDVKKYAEYLKKAYFIKIIDNETDKEVTDFKNKNFYNGKNVDIKS